MRKAKRAKANSSRQSKQSEREMRIRCDLFNYDPAKWKIRYHLSRYYEENLKRQTDDKKALFNNSVNKSTINAICETEVADIASIHERGRQFLQKIRNAQNADFVDEQAESVGKSNKVFLVETGRRVKFGDVDVRGLSPSDASVIHPSVDKGANSQTALTANQVERMLAEEGFKLLTYDLSKTIFADWQKRGVTEEKIRNAIAALGASESNFFEDDFTPVALNKYVLQEMNAARKPAKLNKNRLLAV